MSEDSTENKEYEVGYKKPPKGGQFKKGQSGNPSGKRKAFPHGDNLFLEAMHELVPIQEAGKTVLITRKHLAVRSRVEQAARGNMRALRDLFKLRNTKDGAERNEKVIVFTLDEIRSCGPLEYVLNEEDIVILREPRPKTEGAESDDRAGANAGDKKATRRRRRKPGQPHSQSFKALISFELARRIRVGNSATGRMESMSMREVILKQLATAFALGKNGAMALALRLTESSNQTEPDRKRYVGVPWDYVIPPKPAIPWQQRQPLSPQTLEADIRES